VRGIYAYDPNEPLIHVYKNIQTSHVELYDAVQTVVAELGSCNGDVNRKPATIESHNVKGELLLDASVYNAMSPFEQTSVYGSALFIFLNKTCFRGLFRTGPNGFNSVRTLHGTEIVNRDHLAEIHELIQPVVFGCAGFAESLTTAEPGDFVYLDPPYAPRNPEFVRGVH
jgi:DNA adenine methylase